MKPPSLSGRMRLWLYGRESGSHRQSLGETALWYLGMGLAAFAFVFPFLWMVSTSLKTMVQVHATPPILFPWPPNFSNYADALFGTVPFARYFANTLFIAVAVIIGDVLSSSLIAYGFARIRFPGRDLLFGVMMATMMIPFIVRLVPLFIIFRSLGWINTYYPLTVPSFLGTPFFIFLMRQFYLSIPTEITDAARVDGCTHFGIWRSIMLPLSKPVIAVVAILAFFNVWNDFLSPLIFLNSEEKKTVLLGLYTLVTAPYERPWNLAMAASVGIIAPVMLVFLFFQRYLIKGISISGMKG